MAGYRVGVDIGGTFTDIVLIADDGTVHVRKVSSSVDDYARAIVEGLTEVFADTGIATSDVAEVLHGTTVASNAILESKGARTGLITTRGFRDVLEIRNLRMPRLYDLTWEKPAPLVERFLRLEVDERINAQGEVLQALSRDSVVSAVDRLVGEGVEAVAVCLLNSYANPVHERLVKEVLDERASRITHCISYDVLPEIKEYERTSTTVINAYVKPIVEHYLERLQAELQRSGVTAPLLLMQSNGGLTTATDAAQLPCNIIESGPAGGVVGAQTLAAKVGLPDIITFDMGGTTAKASLVERGEVTRSLEYSVGGGIMIGSRLLTGAGYQLKVPAIDLAEVGAGGGSKVWIDAGGSMQIGPESAGASPGPLCYDLGGDDPTVTDANVALGYINPNFLVGGALRLNAERARTIFAAKVSDPLGLELAHAAYGAHQIAASNMIRAIRAVSSERGRDPRQYAMFAFGGNGPLFACSMARSLQMKRVVIPPAPGLFSSFGLLYADVEHHVSRTLRRVLTDADPNEIDVVWDEIEAHARKQLARDGFDEAHMRFRRAANLHYKGQIFELSVSVPTGRVDHAALAALAEAFGAEHERTYGHRAGPDEPVELVNISVVGLGVPDESRVPETLNLIRPDGEVGDARDAYFGPDFGWQHTPVMQRTALGERITGPAIVEEYDATCVIPPGAAAQLDDYGNIVIDL
ncbi:MAG: hydantoinase/oxoprolinase family protein [Gammaproteobacteria bacterium]|nr:hydantoinase/oxoprolinase family protein [Gammaproteobacteria bacterium]